MYKSKQNQTSHWSCNTWPSFIGFICGGLLTRSICITAKSQFKYHSMTNGLPVHVLELPSGLLGLMCCHSLAGAMTWMLFHSVLYVPSVRTECSAANSPQLVTYYNVWKSKQNTSVCVVKWSVVKWRLEAMTQCLSMFCGCSNMLLFRKGTCRYCVSLTQNIEISVFTFCCQNSKMQFTGDHTDELEKLKIRLLWYIIFFIK